VDDNFAAAAIFDKFFAQKMRWVNGKRAERAEWDAADISFISIILIKLKKNIQGSAAEAAAPADDGEMKSGKCENAKYAAM